MIFPCKFKKILFLSNNKGFSMVEALVGITIAVLLIATFTSLIAHTIKINRANMMGVKATMYLQEMIEIAKDLEQSATSTMFVSGWPWPCTTNCHPEAVGNAWDLVAGPEPLEGFATRTMAINPVSRDPATYEIEPIYNPANESISTKKVTATIIWYDGFQNQTSTLEAYLYYYGP